MTIIDSHVHFWNYDSINYSWIGRDMPVLKQNFLPQQLAIIYNRNQISGCIAVEALQAIDETFQLLKLSAENNFIKAVVGYINLLDPEIESQLQELKHHVKLKGFRTALQAYEPNYMLQPAFINGISKLSAYQFTYDLLLLPQHLAAAKQLVAQFPFQKFVINHLAKPEIRSNDLANWQKDITAIAQYPQVYCKLSGLVTEANWQDWTAETLRPYLDIVVDCFGIDRIMFGSDWPVCLLASEYERWLQTIRDYFESFSAQAQAKVFGENAQLFYNI